MAITTWLTQKIHRRELLVGAATTATGALLLSCSETTTTPIVSTTQKSVTLALIKGVQDDAFYTTMQKGAQAQADELNATLLNAAPVHFEAALQIPIVNAMIERGVDALIIAACDKQALIEPLRRAYDAGIKVIS